MRVFLLVLLLRAAKCSSFSEDVSIASRCYQPTTYQDIDWNKLRGRWFTVLSAPDPLRELPCRSWKSISGTTDGFTFEHSIFDTGAYTWNQSELLLVLKSGNAYVLQTGSANKVVSTLDSLGAKKHKHDKDVLWISELAAVRIESKFFTDYETYILQMLCVYTPTGAKRDIIIRTPSLKLNCKTVLGVRNRLVELGEDWQNVPLEVVHACTDLEED
ncbi:uncharacterized protein LOC120339942 isoform X1 [Styela clava]